VSTDLYGIRVIGREGVSLLLQVFVTYSDVETLPVSKAFFLSVLLDVARPPSRLAARFAGRSRSIEELDDEADAIIEEISQLEETWPENPFVPDGAPPPSPPAAPPARAAGARKPRHRPARSPPLWMHHHRPELRGGRGGWAHEDRLPRGLYYVRLSDARWGRAPRARPVVGHDRVRALTGRFEQSGARQSGDTSLLEELHRRSSRPEAGGLAVPALAGAGRFAGWAGLVGAPVRGRPPCQVAGAVASSE
jgi:hypothetical protein